jgi:hypothetical protein
MREARDALCASNRQATDLVDASHATRESASSVRGKYIATKEDLIKTQRTKVHSAQKQLSRLVVEIEDLRVKIKEDVGGESIYDSVRCDACGMSPLVGKRYKCAICKDYDACEKCYLGNKHGGERHTFFLLQRPGAAWTVAQRDLYSSVKDKLSLDIIVNGLMQQAHAESQQENLVKEHSLELKDLQQLDQDLRDLIKKLIEVKKLLRAQKELSKVMDETIRFLDKVDLISLDMLLQEALTCDKKESLVMLLQEALTCYKKSHQDIGNDGKETLI